MIDPAFMIDLVHQHLRDDESAPAREEAYFAGARLDDVELRDAAAEDEQRRAQARARHAEATRSNLGLGHDIRAGLIQPSEVQLSAVRDIVCRLLARHYGELIAYGAGWTDPERQQPVGDTGRHEPRHPDAIIDAELQRALEDPDPLRGIAQLAARLGAALTLNPAGVTRTKVLGTDRMARKLGDALPGGDSALRARSRASARRPSTSRAARPPQASTTSTSTSSTAQPHSNAPVPPAQATIGREGPGLARRLWVFSFCLAGRSSTRGRSSGALNLS